MRRRIRTSAIAGALLLTACGGGAPQDRPSAAAIQGAQSLACDQFIGTLAPPVDFQVVLGVVALPTAPKAAALQTARSGLGDPSARLFAKAGLIVRAGSMFELAVSTRLSARLSIGWGNPAPPSGRVIVNGCHPSAPGGSGWLDYAGGYWVPRPACDSLLVKTPNHQERVRIGLGTPCPGQRSPQGPTES